MGSTKAQTQKTMGETTATTSGRSHTADFHAKSSWFIAAHTSAYGMLKYRVICSGVLAATW